MGLNIFKQVSQIEVAVANNKTALIFRYLADLRIETTYLSFRKKPVFLSIYNQVARRLSNRWTSLLKRIFIMN